MSFEQKQYWLKGVEYERERITKLFEDNHIEWGITGHDPEDCSACDAIALINGSENVGDEIDNRSEGENK